MGNVREAVERRHQGWDILGAALLGAVLLAAGLLDVRGYFRYRKVERPDFLFLEPANVERAGGSELYLGRESLALLDNMGGLEQSRTARFRHGLGPRSTILFWTIQPHALLKLQFNSAVVHQEIMVKFNDQIIDQIVHQPGNVLIREYPLSLLRGRNEVTFAFAPYNHAGVELSSGDSRPLAGTFMRLDLTLQ